MCWRNSATDPELQSLTGAPTAFPKYSNCRRFWCLMYGCFWTCSLASTLTLFPLFALYPSLNPQNISPKYIAGNNVIEMNFSHLKWISSAIMTIGNCSGEVYVFHGENCSVLNRVRTKESLENSSYYWYGTSPKYFLEGSRLDIINYTDTFIILKSLASRNDYLNLCTQLNDVNERAACYNHVTIDFLCHKNGSTPLLQRGVSFHCFDMMNPPTVSYNIRQSDYYFVIVQSGKRHPYIWGSAYTYDPALLLTLDVSIDVYNTSASGADTNVVSFPVSGQFPFSSKKTCRVLRTKCKDDCSYLCGIYDVTYSLKRGCGVLVLPSALFLLFLFVWLIMVSFHLRRCVRSSGASKHSINEIY